MGETLGMAASGEATLAEIEDLLGRLHTIDPNLRVVEMYFVVSSEQTSQLQRLATDAKVKHILDLPFTPGLGLSLNPEGRYVLVTKPDDHGTDLVMVEALR